MLSLGQVTTTDIYTWCLNTCRTLHNWRFWAKSTREGTNRILLASALSSMRIICPIRVSRRDWIIAVSLGCFLSLRTSTFRTNWYHLMPSSIRRHHWSSASILRAFVLLTYLLTYFSIVNVRSRSWRRQSCCTVRFITSSMLAVVLMLLSLIILLFLQLLFINRTDARWKIINSFIRKRFLFATHYTVVQISLFCRHYKVDLFISLYVA